jgi:hypothetical protein
MFSPFAPVKRRRARASGRSRCRRATAHATRTSDRRRPFALDDGRALADLLSARPRGERDRPPPAIEPKCFRAAQHVVRVDVADDDERRIRGT